MTSQIAMLAVDCQDAEAQARFWCAVLGWQVREHDDDGVSIGPDDGGPGIDLLRVPESKTVKNRLHLDLRADGTSTEAELARLEQLGATREDIGQADDVSWTVLADPEGNEFCLLSRTVQQAATMPG
jgi:catechol 2,3-dioxygenase-like lactoylglutathione lyase family enzyme